MTESQESIKRSVDEFNHMIENCVEDKIVMII